MPMNVKLNPKKWAVSRKMGAICLVWIVAAGIHQLFIHEEPYDYRTANIEERLKNCAGNFSRRYECKSAITLERNNRLFFIWIRRLGIIFVPPLVLLRVHNVITRRRATRRPVRPKASPARTKANPARPKTRRGVKKKVKAAQVKRPK